MGTFWGLCNHPGCDKYEVPTSHLGSRIDPTNVIAVAKAAYGFYKKVLAEAEAKFVG
jgi:hypothetical protein